MFLLIPVILIGYLHRLITRPKYRFGFLNRLGYGIDFPEKSPGARRLWIQATSLGELSAMEPILKHLASNPRNEIFLTATTVDGYASAHRKFDTTLSLIAYFPLDFWPTSSRVWRKAQIDLAVCADSDIWPEHIRQANFRNVPLLVANARISDRSFQMHQFSTSLAKGILGRVDHYFAASRQDWQRLQTLGVPKERITLSGNLKVDIPAEPTLDEVQQSTLKQTLGLGDGFILLGASTWPGEEETLVKAFLSLRERLPTANLLLVPRHIDRRNAIEALLAQLAENLTCHYKSDGPPKHPVDILVGDTYGELKHLIQIADLALIGKTLPPHTQGQTPLECAAQGVPILMGPGVSNFRDLCTALVSVGAARQVKNSEEAIDSLVSLALSPEQLHEMSLKCLKWHAANQGAVKTTLAGINAYLKRCDEASETDI